MNGTKFNTAEDIRFALFELGPSSAAFEDAVNYINSTNPGQSGFAIEHTFALSVGYGYKVNTLQRVNDVRTVVAAYSLDQLTGTYFLITMYPEIP